MMDRLGVPPDSSAMHVAIRESAQRVLAVFEEDQMGLVKHGEGRVIPESAQQAKKQASAQSLTQEDVDAIVAEGRAADDCDADGD